MPFTGLAQDKENRLNLDHAIRTCGANKLPDHRILLNALTYTDPDQAVWHAPEGLIFDGASIPTSLKRLYGLERYGGKKFPAHVVAACFHDAYYQQHAGSSRYEVDRMYGRAMVELGALTDRDRRRRWAASFYTMIRLFSAERWAHNCKGLPERKPAKTVLAARIGNQVKKLSRRTFGSDWSADRIMDACDELLEDKFREVIIKRFGEKHYCEMLQR